VGEAVAVAAGAAEVCPAGAAAGGDEDCAPAQAATQQTNTATSAAANNKKVDFTFFTLRHSSFRRSFVLSVALF
jgi:hypothetical protein